MSTSSSSQLFRSLTSDIRHFFRNPGLVGVTSVLVLLLLVFIVFPIGGVLLKSFTVTFPTVTIISENKLSDQAEAESKVTQTILTTLASVEGIEEMRPETEGKRSVIVLRFRKNWDDMRGLNDAKRALKKEEEKLAPYVEKINFKLGQETIKSLGTYIDFFSKKYYWVALRNSILLAIVTTILVVCIAFCFAYLRLKGPDCVRGPLRLLGLLPLIAPPFIFALSLIGIVGLPGY